MSILDSITNAKEFATLPAVATSILNLLDNQESEVKDIIGLLESDTALSLKLLRIANSPLYASSREIGSIQQAVMMIGFNKLTKIVLGVSIFSKFWIGSKKGAAELMDKFWWHSSSTGTVAKSISEKINIKYGENEFIGGLLHQIGKMAMLQFDIEKYKKVIELIEEKNLTDLEAEKIIFGVSHLEVGDKIAQLWKLPNELNAIIANYHKPSKLIEHKALAATVSFAGLICETNGAPFYKGLSDSDITKNESWEILCNLSSALSDKGLEYITSDIEEQLSRSSEFIGALKGI